MQLATPRPLIAVQPVESSSIAGHGYDPTTRTLQVDFKGGKSYQYDNVAPEVVAELRKAESAGSFINRNIVRGPYKAHKLEKK